MRPLSGSWIRLKRRSFSLMAVYIRTGAFTSPKEMDPVQTARGVFAAGIGGSRFRRCAAGLKDTPPGQKPLLGGESLVGQQREHPRVVDPPSAVELEPQELHDPGVAVRQVE